MPKEVDKVEDRNFEDQTWADFLKNRNPFSVDQWKIYGEIGLQTNANEQEAAEIYQTLIIGQSQKLRVMSQ